MNRIVVAAGSLLFRQAMQNEQARRAFRAWLPTGVGVAAGMSGVVYFTNQEKVPLTGRSHLMLFPSGMESSVGLAAVKESIPEGAKVLPDNHPHTKAVRQIINRLAEKVSEIEDVPEHLRDIEWNVTVVASDTVNALAAPGGHVLVFTGIMDLLNEGDELAAVLGHEMAHVLARHGAESLTRQFVFVPIVIALALFFDTYPDIFETMHTLMVALPGSRTNETEADFIGMHLVARACFDPEGMVKMLQKLEQKEQMQGGKEQPAFMRTHPLTSQRVDDCKSNLLKVKEVLEASGCDQDLMSYFKRSFAKASSSNVYQEFYRKHPRI